jgi:hypothetical protein
LPCRKQPFDGPRLPAQRGHGRLTGRPHRLEAQDTTPSRWEHGFESRWGHHGPPYGAVCFCVPAKPQGGRKLFPKGYAAGRVRRQGASYGRQGGDRSREGPGRTPLQAYGDVARFPASTFSSHRPWSFIACGTPTSESMRRGSTRCSSAPGKNPFVMCAPRSTTSLLLGVESDKGRRWAFPATKSAAGRRLSPDGSHPRGSQARKASPARLGADEGANEQVSREDLIGYGARRIGGMGRRRSRWSGLTLSPGAAVSLAWTLGLRPLRRSRTALW